MEPIRALIVEDNEDDYLLLQNALRRGDFEPSLRRVQTESEFVAALDEKWNIILSDYSLPGFDGAGVIEILRTRKLDVPVIIISGTIGEETAVAAMRLGANDYIMKGNLVRLPGAIRRELKEAQSRKEKRETEGELYQTSLELQRETTILNAVLSSAGEGILVADKNGKFLCFNAAAQQILGVQPWEATPIYPPGFEVFHADQKTPWPFQESAMSRALRGIASDEQVAFVRTAARPEGFWLESTARPLKDKDGAQLGAVVIFRDITRRKLHEKTIAEQQILLLTSSKMSALGEMAGGVAHEIANPLTAILGLTFHLKSKLSPDDVSPTSPYKAVETIEAMAERIGKIVRGLRTFSRDGDQTPIELVFVNDLVGGTLELCREKIRAMTATFQYEESKEAIGLECRPSELSQVILTLISNACDAIEGTKQPWIRLEIVPNGEQLEISVTDSGPGIPVEIQTSIFEPFFTTKKRNRGTGLGLSIAMRILQSHHGDLTIDTTCPNTRFVARLPLRQPRD